MSVIDVSIIIPIYATDVVHDDYLRACLGSCEHQSDDIIIWDDGSSYPYNDMVYAAACDYYARYHHAPHKGKSHSRNGAVEMARHDLILPVDADDWLDEHAVEKMLDEWNSNGGKPVYSDLMKVHPTDARQYNSMPAFDCGEAVDKCIAAISVLHSKDQWRRVGGWDTSRNLYEDWVYNAKLLWSFCGTKIAEPLLYYRQHDLQSTRVSEGTRHNAWVSAKLEIGKFVEGADEMACCGKRRSSPGSTPTRTLNASKQNVVRAPTGSTRSVDMSTTVDLGAMGDPGAGKVWALYLGGSGMGGHDRRGMASRRKYRGIHYGDRLAVVAGDAISREAFEAGAKNCGFVRLEPVATPPPPREAGVSPVVQKTPKKRIIRKPVLPETWDEDIEAAKSMTLRELQVWLDSTELEVEHIHALMTAEEAGFNRIGAVKLYRKHLEAKAQQ